MPETIATIDAKVRRSLRLMGQLAWTPPDLEVQLRLALDDLADLVAIDPVLRRHLVKDYALTFTNEAVDLAAHADLHLESVDPRYAAQPRPTLRVSGFDQPFDWYDCKQDLDYGTVREEAGRWTVEGKTLYARTAMGIANGTGATLRAVFVPVVGATTGTTTLPDGLASMLVELLVLHYRGQEVAADEG